VKRKRKPQPWRQGEVFVLGGTRWAIRVLRGRHVECESMNNPNASIWWTTTLSNLPEKTA
jgi:hypothetical protein